MRRRVNTNPLPILCTDFIKMPIFGFPMTFNLTLLQGQKALGAKYIFNGGGRICSSDFFW